MNRKPWFRNLMACVFLAAGLSACGQIETPTTPEQPSPTLAAPSATPEPEISPTIPPSPEPPLEATPSTPDGSSSALETLDMLDAQNGWARSFDGALLHTRDAGQTWQEVTPTILNLGSQTTTFFLDAQHAWFSLEVETEYLGEVVTVPAIWRTDDGGQSWSDWEALDPAQVLADSDYAQIADLTFINPQQGWLLLSQNPGGMLTQVSLLTTDDGGLSWQRIWPAGQAQIAETACQVNTIAFRDPQFGFWIEICEGLDELPIFKFSNDGGQSWDEVELPAPPDHPDLFQPGNQACNTGEPIFSAPSSITLSLGCEFVGETITSQAWLYRSTDGGGSWTALETPTGPESGPDRSQVRIGFLDSESGWLLVTPLQTGENFTVQELAAHLYWTADGGQNWEPPPPQEWHGTVDFIDRQTGWALADDQTGRRLLSTSDGGQSWSPLEASIQGQARLDEIQMVDAQNGWALGQRAGANQLVLRTTDGGLTWLDVSPPEPLIDGRARTALAFFLDAEHAWASYAAPGPARAQNLTVYHTSDGGEHWRAAQLEAAAMSELQHPEFMHFSDAQNGWLIVNVGVGMSHAYSAIYRTGNGGASWQKVLDPETQDESHGDLHYCCKQALDILDAETGLLTFYPGAYSMPFINWMQDGGLLWQRQDLPAPSSRPELFESQFCGTYNPHLFDSGEALLSVYCEDFNSGEVFSYLYRTSDQGASWQIFNLPLDEANVDPFEGPKVIFVDPRVGWSLGLEVYQTNDGGVTWERLNVLNWEGQFSFVDSQHGWALARAEGEQALVVSEDGGRTWALLEPQILP